LYSRLFSGLDAPFDENLVYSNHHYVDSGLVQGKYPGYFNSVFWDKNHQRNIFNELQGTKFAEKYNVPLWVGEFGSVYTTSDQISDRLQSLRDQIDIFEQNQSHWTIWTYKDVGIMGTVYVKPDSKYMRLIQPVLNAKQHLATDSWLRKPLPDLLDTNVSQLSDQISSIINGSGTDFDKIQPNLSRLIRSQFAANLLQTSFARCFADMDEAQIDDVMQCFAFENCAIHDELKSTVQNFMSRS